MISPTSILLVLATVLVVACGDGGSGGGGRGPADDVPAPGDARFGRAGHVLVTDRNGSVDGKVDGLWVGFDDPDEWNELLRLSGRPGSTPWIVGRVVADTDQPLGFYLDPSTTQAAEVTIETIQTSIDLIKGNPSFHADNPPPFGGHWAISGPVERVVPGAP